MLLNSGEHELSCFASLTLTKVSILQVGNTLRGMPGFFERKFLGTFFGMFTYFVCLKWLVYCLSHLLPGVHLITTWKRDIKATPVMFTERNYISHRLFSHFKFFLLPIINKSHRALVKHIEFWWSKQILFYLYPFLLSTMDVRVIGFLSLVVADTPQRLKLFPRTFHNPIGSVITLPVTPETSFSINCSLWCDPSSRLWRDK